jgi:hypothetical protein
LTEEERLIYNMGNENNTSTPNGQTPNGTDLNGQTPNPQNQTVSGSEKTPISSLPADVQDYIKRLRDEAEEANKQKKAEARAKQQAEEERLKQQGEFKQLAEQHAARVQELEPVATRYSQLSLLVASQIEAQIKDWPQEVKAFDPGNDAPVEERLAWIEKSRPLIEKLQQQARSSNPGNSPNPRPTAATRDDAVDGFMKQMRASGKYGA